MIILRRYDVEEREACVDARVVETRRLMAEEMRPMARSRLNLGTEVSPKHADAQLMPKPL